MISLWFLFTICIFTLRFVILKIFVDLKSSLDNVSGAVFKFVVQGGVKEDLSRS